MAEEITKQQLLNAAPIDEALFTEATGLDSERLDVGAAVDLLMERFNITGGFFDPVYSDRSDVSLQRDMRDTFKFIVNALPEDLREKAILNDIDLRPWLQALQDRTFKSGRRTVTAPTSKLQELVVQIPEAAREQLLADYKLAYPDMNVNIRAAEVNKLLAPGSKVGLISKIAGPEAAIPESDMAGRAAGATDTDPTISVDELRKAFIRTYSSDILDLEALGYEMDATGTVEDITIDVIEPTGTYLRPGAGGAPTNERMNVRAAVDYLYSGQVTPKEVTALQRRMVAAGFFDGFQDGYVPGDAFDDNTNKAWRNLLAQAFTRKMSVDDILRDNTQQRRQRLPDLTKNINRSVFNATAQNIIGRNLTDMEQEGLVTYIQNLQQEQGLRGADPTIGYTEADVTTFMTEEFENEMNRTGAVAGTDTFFKAMRGF